MAPELAAMLYRAFFTRPVGWSGAFILVCVHANNATPVFLNGHTFGEQTFAEIDSNFQDPTECFVEDRQGLFKTGGNELRSKVYNFHAPTVLDYEATIAFTPQ